MSTDSARLITRDQDDVARVLQPLVGHQALSALVGNATYAGVPTNNVTPAFIGQFCRDTANADLYWASTSAAAGWKKLTP